MKDRIIQIMRQTGLSNAEFAEKIGISTSSLSHIFSGRNNPSLDVVKRIHKSFPEISLNWIMYGEGNMYAADSGRNGDTSLNSYDKAPEKRICPFLKTLRIRKIRAVGSFILIFARRSRQKRRFTSLKALRKRSLNT